ncbi:XopAD/skwp family type III secretion system effector [Ralstonia solanacearum]|nr:XopAD/skwp family type III secretion system effector [Ralstonia solanacearum]
MGDPETFATFVHILSILMNSGQARNALMTESDFALAGGRWQESSHVFHSTCNNTDFGGKGYSARLSNLCNRWAHTSPEQGAGCAAMASKLAGLASSSGSAFLHGWLKGGTTQLARDVAMLINALSKWPGDASCKAGLQALADVVVQDKDNLADQDRYRSQTFSMILNGLSKLPESEPCRKATVAVAAALVQRKVEIEQFKAVELSNIVNGLSKWPDQAPCRQAAMAVAEVLVLCKAALGDPEQFLPQHLSNLVNGLGKWPRDAVGGKAALAVAEAVLKRQDKLAEPAQFISQHLSNLINGLSKWPQDATCRKAALAVTAALLKRKDELNDPARFDFRSLSNLVNGLSKWPQDEICRNVALLATQALFRRQDGLSDPAQFDSRSVSNLVNGLSKWPQDAICREAALALAEVLLQRQDGLSDPVQFDSQSVSNLVNGLSKWPQDAICLQAVVAIAKALIQRQDELGELDQFGPQGLSNLINGLSKWPENTTCRKAALAVAAAVIRSQAGLGDSDQFTPQGLSNLINGLSKWPEEGTCRQASLLVAEALLQRQAELGDATQFKPLELSSVLNGLSAWPQYETCRLAAVAVTDALLRRRAELCNPAQFDPQGLSNLINGLSKWPEDKACWQAAMVVAEALLLRKAELRDAEKFVPQGLSNLVNGLSKWPQSAVSRQAAVAVAGALLQRRTELGDPGKFNPQHVSNLINGLSRWPEDETCRQAAVAVAEALLQRRADLANAAQFDGQSLSSLINGLSRWPADPVCRSAAMSIMKVLGSGGRLFGSFDMAGLAQLSNGMARFPLALEKVHAADGEDNADEDLLQMAQARLRELAGHLDSCPDRLAQADTRNVALVFKALASSGLKDELRLLARQGLERLQALQEQTGFRPDNLEALGNLLAGLLPLVRAPELAKHRADTLRLLERMQPTVMHKVQRYIDVCLTPTDPDKAMAANEPLALGIEQDGEAFGTRRPGLTFFLLLKTYAVVAGLWKLSNVPDAPSPAGERRKALEAWVAETLERTRGTIEADLDEMSWNLIAQIEAGDQVLDALDLKLHREVEKIVATHPSTQLDVGAVRRELRGLSEVRDVLGSDAGAAVIEVIDLHGRDIKTRRPGGVDDVAASQYSFFTRLTGGRLPLMEVQLPGKVSAFMLARTIQREGDLLRMDVFGGSHLQPARARIHELLGASDAGATPKRYGRIPAVRLADTAPEAPLMKDVIRKLNPQREDWFRMQRALLETVPRDHVVEGPIRLALLADRLQGETPAFSMRTPEGEAIRLVPNDGCGFIKQSLASRIPVIRDAMAAYRTPPEQRTAAQQALFVPQRMSLLPPQATHHFPRDDGVIEEARQHLRESLVDDPELWDIDPSSGARKIKKKGLYDVLVGANITGAQGTAIPSADDKVYLPSTKSKVFDAKGGPVLLGKAPYDKANLMPVAAERIGTVGKGDATARFLDTAFAFQYSYTAWDERGANVAEGSEDAAAMLHGKGVTIVVPDAMWPENNDAQWVWSTEDMKVHSSWTSGRYRDQLPPRMDTVGSLRVKEIFPPGSLIALPINELKKRDADCDGDKVFVYAGLPKMAQAIADFFKARYQRVGRTASFKPPKTAHGAFDDEGRYQAGRAAEVLSALRGQKLVGRFSVMQFQLTGQPPKLLEALAERALFGTYEGTERKLLRGVRALLSGSKAVTPQVVEDLLYRARTGVQYALHPAARHAAEALQAQLTAVVREMHAPAPHGLSGGAPSAAQVVPEVLAQRFPSLAQAYAQAATPRERLAALVAHYPAALLPHIATTLPAERRGELATVPDVQPGYVPGSPVDTLNNLLTLGVKVGTDAPKAVTQTDLYLKIADRLDKMLCSEPERIRSMPYTKGGVVQELRNDRFHAQANLLRLHDNPTLTAGLMEMAIQELLQQGLIESTPQLRATPGETQAQLTHFACTLHLAAGLAEPHMTGVMEEAIQGTGILRGHAHRLKSEGSLFDKLQVLMRKGHQTPEEAVAAVDDALRYCVVLAPEGFAAGYARILRNLDQQGLTKTRVHNAFVSQHTAFKGINVKFMGRDAEGQTVRLEVQFHTEETFELKERYHDDYKEESVLRAEGASIEERRARLAEAQQACKAVATPPRCEHIEDWEGEPPQVGKRRARAVQASGTGAASVRNGVDAQVQRLVQQAKRIEQQVEPVIKDMQLNVVLEHSAAKKAKSIEKKIHRLSALNGITIEQAAARVRDAMRWVVQLPSETFGTEAAQALADLQARGLRVMRVNNGFAAKERTYAGLNVNLRTVQGLDFAIQFHTGESLYTRNTTHKLYRTWQDKEVEQLQVADPAQCQALAEANSSRFARLKAYAAVVPTPYGVEAIPSIDRYMDSETRQVISGTPRSEPCEILARVPEPSSAAVPQRPSTLDSRSRPQSRSAHVSQPLSVTVPSQTPSWLGATLNRNMMNPIVADLQDQWRVLQWELAGTGIALGHLQPEHLGDQLSTIQCGFERKTENDLKDLAENPGLRLDWARREQLYQKVVIARASLELAPQERPFDLLYSELRAIDEAGGLTLDKIDQCFIVGRARGQGNACLFDSLYQAVEKSGNRSQRLNALFGTRSPTLLRTDFAKHMQHLMYRGGLLGRDQYGRYDQMDFGATSVVMVGLANLLDLQMVFLNRQNDGRFHLNPPIGNGSLAVFLQREVVDGANGHFSPLWPKPH